MGFPVVFLMFCIFVGLFYYHIKRTTRLERLEREKFWSKEEASLIVRKKDFHKEDFLIPNLASLKLDASHPEIAQLIQKIKTLATYDMMSFPELSNTELRLQFGTANQSIISQNEENYHSFLRCLASYGKIMLEYQDFEEAKHAFEECIRLKSDFSEHYVELAKLYLQEDKHSEMEALIEKARSLSTLNKDIILNRLSRLSDTFLK
ncbi:MAG: hypothetical protein JW708_01370 [Vallitaleaceae bacterium]|nr:hypothetical protein [Vallitaleaceae bacterium]